VIRDALTFIGMLFAIVLGWAIGGWFLMKAAERWPSRERPRPMSTFDDLLKGKDEDV
jgi:hypothetical protein